MLKEIQIEELPDLKAAWYESYKYLDEPLLEYVWQMANKFLPSFDGENFGESSAIGVFCQRYFDENSTFSRLDIERYIENEELQKNTESIQFGCKQIMVSNPIRVRLCGKHYH